MGTHHEQITPEDRTGNDATWNPPLVTCDLLRVVAAVSATSEGGSNGGGETTGDAHGGGGDGGGSSAGGLMLSFCMISFSGGVLPVSVLCTDVSSDCEVTVSMVSSALSGSYSLH